MLVPACLFECAQYVSTATNLYAGLAGVVAGYAGSQDPAQALIYALWQATATRSSTVSAVGRAAEAT